VKIIFSIFKGIENIFIIPLTRIIFGIAVISTFIIYFAMEASWTKALLFFGMIPFSLFISGQFENKPKYEVSNFNNDYMDYKEDNNAPVVDRIERKTTNTTTTTETIYFKKGVKYLE
jgi:hypothetical protein